jgi:ABC-2 type transport system ATP-binding protein
MQPLLKVEHLVKNYGQFRAVDDISFTVDVGQVVGFLGPNGAGKTTTIQILIGITLANGGKIEYFGHDFESDRQACLQRLNYTSAFNTLLGRITVLENLRVYAELYNVHNPLKKISQLAEYFEMEDLLQELYQNLSAGQKTRVNLVKALLNDPELLLMDEPTASLDPDIADKTLTYIENLRRDRNLAILYTSHNMDEITRVCDEVIFFGSGQNCGPRYTTQLNQKDFAL